ncbi:flagellin [Burkholderia sp. BCC0044]|uniref:flagellin N-terminal helical domain-containing protein n=1 Tax=Burkholderia sp. BCC0044 TaxID=2676295 RepID=UPI00158D9610|nr:flagellin [Burkholderia sp. BCC0044]
MLSLHTNAAAMNIQKAIGNTRSDLNTTMTRLGTGLRINSAKDDAAGLQIAVRLQAQTRGMGVAMQNTQNASSMLQTADGAMNEVTNILYRMKDLATQAADGSSSADDKTAMQAEYDALGKELFNITSNTSYGGAKLISENGSKLSGAVDFQIGASASEKMTFNVATELGKVHTDLKAATKTYGDNTATGDDLTATANATIGLLETALDSVGALRSAIGAGENRLDHVYNNLSNMSMNTTDAEGRIMDADMAAESAKMSSQQVLMQAGMAMLKQSSSMNQMVLSLIQ